MWRTRGRESLASGGKLPAALPQLSRSLLPPRRGRPRAQASVGHLSPPLTAFPQGPASSFSGRSRYSSFFSARSSAGLCRGFMAEAQKRFSEGRGLREIRVTLMCRVPEGQAPKRAPDGSQAGCPRVSFRENHGLSLPETTL